MDEFDFYALISKAKLEKIKELLDDGFDVNASDDTVGFLSHAVACINEKAFEICKLLIERGADIHAITCSDWTILYRACLHRNFSIIRYLLKKGADPKRGELRFLGQTPFQVIEEETKLLLLFAKYAHKLDEKEQKKIENLRLKVVFRK